MATRRWYYLIPATASLGVWSTRSSVTISTACRARSAPTRGASSWPPGSQACSAGIEARGDGVFARTTPSRTCRGSMPARSRRCGQLGVEVVSSGDLVQRFEAVWSDAAYETHTRGLREALPDQGPHVRADRERAGERRADERVRGAAADGRLVRGRGAASSQDPPNVSAQENAGNPHYSPTRDAAGRFGADEMVLLDLWGKLPQPGAVFADITWVGFTGDAGAGRIRHARSPRRATAVTRPSTWCETAVARRTRPARLRGRPRLPRRDRTGRLRRPVHPSHRAQPRRETSTATACTWTTTKRTTIGG